MPALPALPSFAPPSSVSRSPPQQTCYGHCSVVLETLVGTPFARSDRNRPRTLLPLASLLSNLQSGPFQALFPRSPLLPMANFPSVSRLSQLLRLWSILLWTARVITLTLALPPPQVPAFRPTPTPELPSRVLADNDDVRWLARPVNATHSIDGLDPLGSITRDDSGESNNVPMGWVDPRLRGGRMLDVGPSDIEPRRHIEHSLTKPPISLLYSSLLYRVTGNP